MLGLLLALSSCLPVEGDRILVRDLAAAAPVLASIDPEKSIGLAPAPGAQRRFTAGELNRFAASQGVTAEIEPLCFERPLAPLSRAQVMSAIQTALPEGAQFELLDFSVAQIPKGRIEFPASGLTPPRPTAPRDPTIWRGHVVYTANRGTPIWAKVRVWTSRQGVVAVSDLHSGKPIEPGQIRIENVDALPFSDAAPLSIEQVSGMVPRRPIRAGEVITAVALSEPNDVTRGETVGVEAHAGAAVLKFEGRAEASGRVGASIAVRNPDSGKVFQARVLRKGWVVVERTE